MMGRRRVRTAVLAVLAALPLVALSLGGGLAQTAGAADLAVASDGFVPEPGSVVQKCGPRWWQDGHWVKRCGQTSAGYGRTGFYHSDTNRGVWNEWRLVVSKIDVEKMVTAVDGNIGCFYGYPQFRRASDGHTLSYGTQMLKTASGTKFRIGYFDHNEQRFHPPRDVDPHLYPGDPRPGCPTQ